MNSPDPWSKLALRRKIDRVCGEFEAAFRRDPATRLERFLGGPATRELAPLFVELLRAEHELRCAVGETPGIEEYQQRFPHLRDLILDALRPLESVATNNTRSRPAAGLRLQSGDRYRQYEILGHAGTGGISGNVYRAWDHHTNRQVAIKLSVRDEAKAMAKYDGYPNFARIHECHKREEFGDFVVIMEYVDGPTLDQFCESRRRELSKPEWWCQACGIGAQLADALSCVHRNQELHLDIKPQNILVDRGEIVKLIDFNASRRTQDEVRGCGGTKEYMSPDQLAAFAARDAEHMREAVSALNNRSDVYSFGVVLQEMLVGSRPISSSPGPSTEANEEELAALPGGIQRILRRCLAKDPADRFAYAAELAHELRLCTDGKLQRLLYPPPTRWLALLTQWRVALAILSLLAIVANGLVTSISVNWNNAVLADAPAELRADFQQLVLWVNGLAYGVGAAIGVALGIPLFIGLRAAGKPMKPERHVWAIRCALRIGHHVALVSLALWVGSGLVWWCIASSWHMNLDDDRARLFGASVIFEGALAAPLVFFPLTFVCVRLYLPLLLREQRTPAKLDFDWLLNAYSFLGFSGVLLVLWLFISYAQGEQLATFRLLLVFVLLLGAVCIALSFLCMAAIRRDLQWLEPLTRGPTDDNARGAVIPASSSFSAEVTVPKSP